MDNQEFKNYRHGDVSLVQEAKIGGETITFNKLPSGLKVAKEAVLMKGSHGNNHSFKNGVFYPTTDERYPFLIGYFKAEEGATLIHLDHGKQSGRQALRIAKVPAGVYAVMGQHEDTHSGMQAVID